MCTIIRFDLPLSIICKYIFVQLFSKRAEWIFNFFPPIFLSSFTKFYNTCYRSSNNRRRFSLITKKLSRRDIRIEFSRQIVFPLKNVSLNLSQKNTSSPQKYILWFPIKTKNLRFIITLKGNVLEDGRTMYLSTKIYFASASLTLCKDYEIHRHRMEKWRNFKENQRTVFLFLWIRYSVVMKILIPNLLVGTSVVGKLSMIFFLYF